MDDKFQNAPDEVAAPARNVFAITPHDINEVSPIPKAIRADADGAVTFRAVDSSADVTLNMVAGEVLPVRVQYLRDTGTDAITVHGLA